MNYLISNITNFHQKLKCGRMKDQVGLLIQYYNPKITRCEGSSYFPLNIQLRNPMKELVIIQYKDKACFMC